MLETYTPVFTRGSTGPCPSGGLLQMPAHTINSSRDPGGTSCNAASYSAIIGCARCQFENTEATRRIRQKPRSRHTTLIRAGDAAPQPKLANAKNATPEGNR